MKLNWMGWNRWLCVVLMFGAAVSSCLVYASQMSVVRALRGATTSTEHEYRLRRAVSLDSSNGLAKMQLSRVASVARRYDEAMDLHVSGMQTYRPFSSYEELGRLYEREAAADPQNAVKLQAAAHDTYAKALLLYPGDISLLKRMAELSIRVRDREGVTEYTEAILNRSLNDPDAVYFRALDAEAAGEVQRAYRLFQQVATRSREGISRYYSPDSLKEKLKALESHGARHKL